ncbi:MAG: AarF/ABC1/UbiB kinase family protein [Ichthyobacteriaceae bacterium]|nr:AarF/ABC1/UbiB kinase family protein [Ichthyobacteriaceae bacterium]
MSIKVRNANLKKLNNNKARVKEIVSTLSKYGLASWLSESKIDWINKRIHKNKPEKISTQPESIRIRLAIDELGTTFIKLGQMLSMRPDVIGDDLADELTKLQTKTKTDNSSYIEEIIKTELDLDNIKDAFADFNINSIASASVAQVHSATLLTGEKVVVKIIHQGIEVKVLEDMEILEALAQIMENRLSKLKQLQTVKLVKEFKRTILNEFDFDKELENIEKFEVNFNDNKWITFPKVYENYSTKNILTMQFIEGKELNEIVDDKRLSKQNAIIAERIAKAYLDMIFRDNYYHADPHPGNFFVQQKGVVAFIDFGMVGSLSDDSVLKIENLIIGFVEKNSAKIKDSILEIGSVPKDYNEELFSTQVDYFINNHLNGSIKDVVMGDVIKDAGEIINDHAIILPADISMLMRVLLMLESTVRKLDPEVNLIELLKGYYIKMVIKKLSPKRILKLVSSEVSKWKNIVELTPKVIIKLLNAADKENFKINLEHKNLETTVNSLVTGLLAAALFLGSSLIMSARIEPLIGELSVLGLLGMVVATFMGAKLLFAISRKKDK